MKKFNSNFKGYKKLKGRNFTDNRGLFREIFKAKNTKKKFIFWCISKSKKNVVRGLHMQTKIKQELFVSVLKGKIFDVIVDLRPRSRSFGKYKINILSEKNANSLYVPKGFAHGFCALEKENIVLYGSVDDIWLDTKNDKFIMVDYKSQANEKSVSQDTYFKDAYKSSYQTQLDFYAYLLKAQNIKEVSDDAYLYVVNARGLEQEFDNKLLFEPTLIHTKIKTDYLEDEIQNMINTMNSTKIPDSNKSCNNCAYARQRSKTDTL